MTFDETLQVRLTKFEHARLLQRAKLDGRSLSATAREALRKGLELAAVDDGAPVRPAPQLAGSIIEEH